MGAKETVMKSGQWQNIYSEWLKCPGGTAGDLANMMNEAQAEISFKAGIREVGICYEKYLRGFGASDDMIKANTWLQSLLQGELPN